MPWRRFFLFNAAGAVGWCTTLALLAAVVGPAGAASVSLLGLLVTGGGAAAEAIRAIAARRRVSEPEIVFVSV
jgi:membrane protein DedA with SNARE-associated domain